MSKFRQVVRWEFFKAIKSKQFIVTTVLIPLIMGVGGVVPALVDESQKEERLQVAVTAGTVQADTARALRAERIEIVQVSSEGSAEEALNRGAVDGALLYSGDGGERAFRLLVREARRAGHLREGLTRALTQEAIARRLARLGLAPAEAQDLFKPVPIVLVPIEGAEAGLRLDVVPLVFAALLMLAAFFSGNVLMQSVIKEKQNRIVEILFSSMSPLTLMNGKILAYAALGLVQLAIWTAAGLLVAFSFWDFEWDWVQGRSVMHGLPYFLLGYLLYASMFASLGAATRDAQSGGQIQGTLVVVPVVPLMLAGPIIADPNALWVRVLGFIPFFTPGTFLLRSALAPIPMWEYLLSLSLLAATAWFALRSAGRIFFMGLLMTGRPASLREITRWIAGR